VLHLAGPEVCALANGGWDGQVAFTAGSFEADRVAAIRRRGEVAAAPEQGPGGVDVLTDDREGAAGPSRPHDVLLFAE
jgi:hypothetical protein